MAQFRVVVGTVHIVGTTGKNGFHSPAGKSEAQAFDVMDYTDGERVPGCLPVWTALDFAAAWDFCITRAEAKRGIRLS